MIAKTVTGSDFTGALEYGAGLRADRTNKQAELLSVANVGSQDAAGIAAEMRDVADMSSRIQQPVWHTVLSWAPGEKVSREQKITAAARYCELMGAALNRHQVAVYEHKDKDHPHIHIYINRVPIDGGPALRTDNNYARNVKATKQIRQQLGLPELPTRRQTTRDLDPSKEATRGHVREVLTAALANPAIRSLDQLLTHLKQKEIQAVLKRDGKGMLVGSSFRYQETSMKGTDVGIKAKQLRDHFSPFGREALHTASQGPAAANTSGIAPGPAAASQGPLSFEDGVGAGAGADDATQNENVLKRKKRRQRHH
ncbi:MAG: relaxase/mobilization nuclease domain-containing protein [Janthinobacterium lividum]